MSSTSGSQGASIGFRDLQRRCREAGIAAGIAAATADSTWQLTPLSADLVSAMGPLTDWSRTWAEPR
ncbi:hypothetical protein ACIP79_04120 [Streptomyces sp. NPDC088747]|uniref:hypothetical protein n=1 Tax=Streptomyces sp. NPDC088747 TaxID=3365886 RepID=UPI00382F2708